MKIRIVEVPREGYHCYRVEQKGWFGWKFLATFPAQSKEAARNGALLLAEKYVNPEIIYVEKKEDGNS